MTMPPLMLFIKRAHRILTRMGIPALGYESEGDMHGMYDRNIEILLDRLKTLQLYQNALRGKWLREKKKAVAANRALEAFRSGQTKSWKQRYEAVSGDVTRAMEVWRKDHKPMTSIGHSGHSLIASIVMYLVDRSNQLHANDSVVQRNANDEVKLAKAQKATAETNLMTVRRRLQWYEQRFGFYPDEMVQDSLAAGLPGKPHVAQSLASEADSFPWKRGNPGYLGDYTIHELIDEVQRRANAIVDDAEVARGIAGRRNDAKKD